MYKAIIFILSTIFFLNGCGRKKEATLLKEQEEIEQLPLILQEPGVSTNQIEPQELKSTHIPDRPTIKDIQRALKNAGFYTGRVDGIIGPKTRKAIKDFQAKNGLVVDGKVGPKTWGKLKEYFNKAKLEN